MARPRVWFLFALAAPLLGIAQPSTPQWRPVYHFTPDRNWTNDPNGLLYLGGVYHLYNQQNPFANEWGHMSWGHATSTDLVHWKHLPVALPERTADTTWRFSGSAVYDAHNTSGFCTGGKGCIVAIYTADQPGRKRETQFVAYSNDGGTTLTDYSGNPVIDLHRKDFRDPNVSWNEPLHQWLMVVSLVDEHKVRFYTSPDLKAWTALSDFGPQGFVGESWECPAFFRLPVEGTPGVSKWVLAVSSGFPHGSPFIQYFVGDFDGKTFTTNQDAASIRPVDYGNTFYAAIPWNGQPAGKRTYLGWLVPEAQPTYPWRGAMSIPRDLSLREEGGAIVLCQEPAALIKKGLPVVDKTNLILRGNENLNAPKGNAWWLTATIRLNGAGRAGFKVARNPETGTEVIVGYDRVIGAVYVDRTHSDTTGLSRDRLLQSMPVSTTQGTLTLTILLDKSILEVFVNHGEQVLTTWVFPAKGDDGVAAFGSGGALLEHLKVWNMDNVP